MSGVPADYERRLMNGAMVLCGPGMLPTMRDMAKAGLLERTTVVASDRASALALPDTLMIHALLVYPHYVPGAGREGPDPAALSAWRSKLLGALSSALPGEPVPAIELNADPGVPEVILQLTWSPGDGDWQGVRSSQVKRVAEQLDGLMASLNGGVAATAPASGSKKLFFAALAAAGLALLIWLASK